MPLTSSRSSPLDQNKKGSVPFFNNMKGTFGDIISASWEWTKTVLFRPFKFKKWIFLCIIAMLAVEFSGCNLNLNYPAEKSKASIIQRPDWLIPLIIALAIIGLVLTILFLWLYSRFSFIFLSSIIRNDASIKGPFKENKREGNSFFKWNILFLLAVIIISLTMLFIFISGVKISILSAILWIFILFLLVVFSIIINVTAHDLVLPIMYKDRTGIIKGWQTLLGKIKSEKLNFTKYLLIKLGLRILANIASGLFSMVVFFALLIQLGIIGSLLYSVSFTLPEVIKLGYYILLIVLGVISFIAIIFIINLILLPIPVYFRTYSLKFLARLDEKYDLFRLT